MPFMAWHSIYGMARHSRHGTAFTAWHGIYGFLCAPLPTFQRPVIVSGTVLTTGASVAVIVTACVTWLRQVLIGNGALLAPAGDRGGKGKERKGKGA